MFLRKLDPGFGCMVSATCTAIGVFPGTSDGMFTKSFGDNSQREKKKKTDNLSRFNGYNPRSIVNFRKACEALLKTFNASLKM